MNTTTLVVIAVAVIALVLILAMVMRRSRLRTLDPETRDRFATEWHRIETRFIDQPREAVAEADRLATAVMRERGQPMGDARRLPEDLREARLHAASPEQGTEGLRIAMTRYQAIIDAAVGKETRREAERGNKELA